MGHVKGIFHPLPGMEMLTFIPGSALGDLGSLYWRSRLWGFLWPL